MISVIRAGSSGTPISLLLNTSLQSKGSIVTGRKERETKMCIVKRFNGTKTTQLQ
jgi:hypothetical protein